MNTWIWTLCRGITLLSNILLNYTYCSYYQTKHLTFINSLFWGWWGLTRRVRSSLHFNINCSSSRHKDMNNSFNICPFANVRKNRMTYSWINAALYCPDSPDATVELIAFYVAEVDSSVNEDKLLACSKACNNSACADRRLNEVPLYTQRFLNRACFTLHIEYKAMNTKGLQREQAQSQPQAAVCPTETGW